MSETTLDIDRVAAFIMRLASDDLPMGVIERRVSQMSSWNWDTVAAYLDEPPGQWARKLAAQVLGVEP